MKKMFLLSAAVFTMLLLDGIMASAQQAQYSCIISNGRKCYVYYDTTGHPADTVCDEGSTGIGTFRGSGIRPTGRVDADLIPTTIIASIQDPLHGTITTTLDPERQPNPTRIRSVDGTNRFPLDVTISFYATASVQSVPGRIFRSRTQLVFSSSTVTSLNPFNGEVLPLKEDVEFYDPADSTQRTAFALQGGTTTVTLGVREPQPEYSCILINGRKCYINFGPNGQPVDTVCDQGGTGVGTFTSLTGSLAADSSTVNAELAPTDITATIADATHGTITTRLDPSRASSVTTIRSADGVNRFPLDVNINFYATASVESAPGKLYRSRTQLEFSSIGVRSLNPFKGEVATLKNNVEFYDTTDPTQVTAFALQGSRTTITLGTSNPPGPEYDCILINGRKCYVYYDDNGQPIDTICDEGTKGIGTFRGLRGRLSGDSTDSVDAVLLPIAISASVPDPTRGTITTGLDPSRQSSPTTIRSVDGPNRFPLAVNISFYATALVESAPGTLYRSRTQLVFSSNNVRSLNPFKNEVLTLKENVEFYNAADPDRRTLFTLQGGRTTVTLSSGISSVDKEGGIELRLDLR